MKSILVSLSLLVPSIAFAQTTTMVIIEPESSFRLSGVSNVNEFDCRIVEGFCGEQLSVCYEAKDGFISFDNTKFSLTVEKFDCESNYITRDMKKTLKGEKFPFMHFQLLNIENFDPIDFNDSRAETLITIAGKTNKYFLKYEVLPIDAKSFHINFKSEFDIKEFGIDPPTAMMGLIKVNETIFVELNLKISMK